MNKFQQKVSLFTKNVRLKQIPLFLLYTLFAFQSNAQTTDRKWNLGIYGGLSTYAGSLGNGMLNFKSRDLEQNLVGGLSLTRYISKSFDVSLMTVYGTWGFYNTTPPAQDFKSTIMHANIHFKYKLNNGYLISENAWLAPYLFAGYGATSLMGSRVNKGMDYPIVGGLGLKWRVNDVLSFSYQGTFGYMSTAHNDPNDAVAATGNDKFLFHTIGIDFNLGRGKDEDKDGVTDRNDKCSGTPANVKVDAKGCPFDTDGDGILDYQDKCPNQFGSSVTLGCPDLDKDGVADADDQCPNEPGLKTLNGCPDSDGDGIIDSKDKCPNVKGSLVFDGCPDTDGDGIKDELDACPDVKGIAAFKGCPDTDNDGIEDSKDMCPNVKGPASTNGCPDTDNDGVNDGIDKCPEVAGSPSHSGCPDTDNDGVFDDIDKCVTIPGTPNNNGCPEIKLETKQLFQKALQGIQFETGKAIIKPVSFPILNAIVKVMVDNKNYKLLIGGHTDNVGDDAMNMTLSQDRATSVSNYLIAHGVDPMRVSSKGYGETTPVDDNNTVKGRTRNRRVELEVEFLEIVK